MHGTAVKNKNSHYGDKASFWRTGILELGPGQWQKFLAPLQIQDWHPTFYPTHTTLRPELEALNDEVQNAPIK